MIGIYEAAAAAMMGAPDSQYLAALQKARHGQLGYYQQAANPPSDSNEKLLLLEDEE